jgi:hypothetical protein
MTSAGFASVNPLTRMSRPFITAVRSTVPEYKNPVSELHLFPKTVFTGAGAVGCRR